MSLIGQEFLHNPIIKPTSFSTGQRSLFAVNRGAFHNGKIYRCPGAGERVRSSRLQSLKSTGKAPHDPLLLPCWDHTLPQQGPVLFPHMKVPCSHLPHPRGMVCAVSRLLNHECAFSLGHRAGDPEEDN